MSIKTSWPCRFWLRARAALAVVAILTIGAHSAVAAPAQQAYLKASDTKPKDYFGFAVHVSGDTLVVGAHRNTLATGYNDGSSTNPGAAYIFTRNGTNWGEEASLKGSNTAADAFGYSVAVSGNTVVVGALRDDSSATGVNANPNNSNAPVSGAAYVFVRNGTNWTQQAYLKAENSEAGDHFGISVAISGDTLVVGAHFEGSNASGSNGNQNDNSLPGSGAAYVFVRNGTNWSQQAYLKASNPGQYNLFGVSVAVSSDTVVVGSHYENSNAIGVNGNQATNTVTYSGAAYVFVRSGTNWSQQAYLKASNASTNYQFGRPVAIFGDRIVAGAIGTRGGTNFAQYAGAAYVFERTGTNWIQEAYLRPSTAEYLDYFGERVAISGDTIVVGADGEDSGVVGLNGLQTDNSANASGAAYAFVRVGTNWIQQAYLKASNTGANDWFGWAVGLSGDTAVVGAFREDSSATGVNGDSSDESAYESGAVYVFNDLGIGPRLAIVPDGSIGYFLRFTGAPDVSYRVERAGSMTGPWLMLATLTAPASGLIEFHDVNPPQGQGFYRTAHVSRTCFHQQ